MGKEDILNTIKLFAKSNGYYSGLLKQIEEKPEILDELEEQNFGDAIDLIMYIEC